jgi:hypothetical protein
MRRSAVFKWWKRFKDGETNVKTACSTILLKLEANVLVTARFREVGEAL